MIPSGLEPETYCLEGSCSIQLSYGTDLFVFAGAKVVIFLQIAKFYTINLIFDVLPSMTAMKSLVMTIPSSLFLTGLGLLAACILGLAAIELGYEVRAPDAVQALLNVAALLGLVPEEILALGEFLARTLGAEDGL